MAKAYDYYDAESKVAVLRHYLKREGLLHTSRRAGRFMLDIPISHLLFLKRQRYFLFNDKPLPYLYARYNKAWKNERTIEIPLVRSLLSGAKKDTILELGNVLQHYGPAQHAIVDKYEKAPDVINEDILTYNPGKK